MQPPEDGAYQPAYAAVVPAPDAPEGDGPLVLEWPPEAPPPAGVEARRAGEAAALAAVVRRAVAGHTWTVRDRGGGPARPVGFGAVVCLFRTLGAVAIYEDAFRAAGVPYRTLGGRHYFARSEVGWALAALTAVEDPHDPVALVAALRSPFFGVPDGALLAHKVAGRAAELPGAAAAGERAGPGPRRGASSASSTPGACARARRRSWRRSTRRPRSWPPTRSIRPASSAWRISCGSSTRRARSRRPAGGRSGRSCGGSGPRTAAATRRASRPSSRKGDEVVRLMTVHSAKGLEFPVVILPDLEWDRGADSRRLWVDRRAEAMELGVSLGKVGDWEVDSDNVEALRDREQRRADAEQLRLFYVATTRARDHLVLPLLFGGRAPRVRPLLRAVYSTTTDEGVAAPVRRGRGATARGGPAGRAPSLVPADAWRAGREAALARGRETAAALHPGDTGAARGDGVRLGALVHGALALAALGDGPAGAAAAVAAAAARLGERGPRIPAAIALVARALAAPPYRRAPPPRKVYRELPVSAVVEGHLVEGVVDLAFETPKGLAVVEVKLAPAGPEADSQLAVYCQALAAAGLTVAEGWLLVVGRSPSR